MTPARDISRLIEIMAALRDPATGCPWDIAQDFASIVPYTIEEAYEVADAIEHGDLDDLRDELGDLLLQVVFHARMAQEQGAFDFGGVVEAITSKLIRRHPHVFAGARDLSAAQVRDLWGSIKAQERAEHAARHAVAADAPKGSDSLLAGVPTALPALTRALKLQEKAATVGFDWNNARQVLAKIREETDEVEAALDAADAGKTGTQLVMREAGDLLFATVNLLRHLQADPESILREANAKFVRRFRYIEASLAALGKTFAQTSLDEMESLWTQAKRGESGGTT